MIFGRKVEDAMTDIARIHGYPPNIRRIWYEHVNSTPLPAQITDQDWHYTLGEILKTWEETAEYMINKRDTGRAMLEAEEIFMTRPAEAIGLPIQLYTHRKTYDQAIKECQEITTLGETCCSEANRFYSLEPDTRRPQRGIIELI